MMFEATLIYSENLIRRAVWLFWKRTVGVSYLLLLIAMICVVAVLAVQGNRSWFMGIMGTVVGMGYLMLVSMYVVHFKNSMAKFRDMGSSNAIFRAEDLSFTIESRIGMSKLQWSAVKEIWQFQDLWLLLFSKAQYITLPLANVPSETQAFILEKVKIAGGKIQ